MAQTPKTARRISFSRREIIRLYKEQMRNDGELNVKAIQDVLGNDTLSYIYKVIREYKQERE